MLLFCNFANINHVNDILFSVKYNRRLEKSVPLHYRHFNRSPNSSIGHLEEQKLRAKTESRKSEVLQVMGNMMIQFCKHREIPSFVVSDLVFHYSSYYKKILAKQNEMNDVEKNTTEYLHEPR